MKIKALALRIIKELSHDKRTLALMFFAPILVLSLIYFVLDSTDNPLYIAVVNAPQAYIEELEEHNVIPLLVYADTAKANEALAKGDVTAILNIVSGKTYVALDGTDPAKANRALNAIEQIKINQTVRPDLITDVNYIYGYEEMSDFDNYGAIFIGFVIFFFVFIIAGISFLRERTGGTLEKLLSTPIRRLEIVSGYVFGFGTLTVLQAFVISWFCIYILKMNMTGSFLLVILVSLLTAFSALTLGILMSTAANNEFQMMQFIPIIVIPQIFFSGLFDLSAMYAPVQAIGYTMPLYYSAEALRIVMLRGGGFFDISLELAMLLIFSLIFMFINVFLLKRYRDI